MTVDGEAEVKGSFTLEDILKPHALEERIYRLRCVEAWSMVIPWMGFPLADLLKRFKPTSNAQSTSSSRRCIDPKQMPGQRYRVLDWPYVEGLRMDEAMHPLTFMAVGLYGQALPNQNGAPLRLVVPWKYGFKSIKSIVRIRFTEKQPRNSWQVARAERVRLLRQREPGGGSSALEPGHRAAHRRRAVRASARRRCPSTATPTQVASLYKGMDLRRNF